MAGRITPGPGAPTVNDLQHQAYTIASDGKAALVVSNPDGSAVGAASTSSGYSYNHQSANGTVTIKSGAGTLHTVTINTAGTADTVTLYDSTTGTGTVIAVIGSATEISIIYDIAFSTGLTAVITGTTAPDVTFSYK